MNIVTEPHDQPRIATETVRRRWRFAALLGLVVLSALTTYVVVSAARIEQANRSVAVLTAARDIWAGTTVRADELDVQYLRVDDPAVLGTLAAANERHQIVGRVATDSVRAGAFIPAGFGEPAASAGMWEAPLPVRRMPRDLAPGDHVALIVAPTTKSNEAIEFTAMQDVRVVAVRSDVVTVWIPASAAAQMEWYADHGGIVAVRVPAGITLPNLPAGVGG
jgi:hypothetical protein